MLNRCLDNLFFRGSADALNSYTRRYIYTGDDILAEYDASNTLLARFYHGPLGADDALGVNVTDDGVAAGIATTAKKYLFLSDAIKNVTDVVDLDGTLVQSYQYLAFGKVQKVTDGSGTDITATPVLKSIYTFTSREFDSEIGLYFNRARYFDPSIGRSIQQDPDPGSVADQLSSMNKYIYARNNPGSLTDPTGKYGMQEFWHDTGDALHNAFGIGMQQIADLIWRNRKEILLGVIAVAAAVTGVWVAGALAGTLGLTGAVLVATAAGAGVGAVIGGFGYGALQLGPTDGSGWNQQGARDGAITGAISGLLGGASAVGWLNPYGNFIEQRLYSNPTLTGYASAYINSLILSGALNIPRQYCKYKDGYKNNSDSDKSALSCKLSTEGFGN